MTAQSDIDEVRLIEAQAAPARFARGWHCLGLIRDFGDGKPHAINAFGQKLVVFRSGDGTINVLDAYCRHMGGDLSQREVKGEDDREIAEPKRTEGAPREQQATIPCQAHSADHLPSMNTAARQVSGKKA